MAPTLEGDKCTLHLIGHFNKTTPYPFSGGVGEGIGVCAPPQTAALNTILHPLCHNVNVNLKDFRCDTLALCIRLFQNGNESGTQADTTKGRIMQKPGPDSKQPFSTDLPRDITFNRTCRSCGAAFQCDYFDYSQWLDNSLAKPWKRERVCSAACHKIVGDMPIISVKPIEVTKVPFYQPLNIVRHIVSLHAPGLAGGPVPALRKAE